MFRFLYELNTPIKKKIETIAKEMYGAASVEYSELSNQQIELYTKQGFGKLPICMAKTQLSLSHDPNKKGAPTDFVLPIKEVDIATGAGFIFPLCKCLYTWTLTTVFRRRSHDNAWLEHTAMFLRHRH